MNSTVVFLGITVLFFLLLAGKSLLKKEFCVICLSVGLTWLAMLFARFAGYETDATLLAVLIGGSAVGGYYWLDSKVSQPLKIFRLPFLLTLFFVVYAVIGSSFPVDSSWLVIVFLWFVFGLIYIFRFYSGLGSTIKKIIECCKNW